MKGKAVAVGTFGGFRKRTQTLDEWVNGTRWLAVRWRDLWGGYGRRTGPAMREANVAGDALDALLARWRGQAPADSRLLDDLALGSFAFAILLRRSLRRVLREWRGFVGTYDVAEEVGG